MHSHPGDRTPAFALGDAPAVHALAGAPEVAAMTLHIPHPYPEGAAEEWIVRHEETAAAGQGYTWAIASRDDGVLMGAIGMSVNPEHARAEIGYWLGVPYWGQGYMTEAARRVVAYGFDELHLTRIQASCLPRNRASSG